MDWESIQVGDEVDCTVVYRHVERIHNNPYDFDEGDLTERIYRFSSYRLERLPITLMDRGSYMIDEELIEKYKERPMKTMPPIVVGEIYGNQYDVVDGNHRVESAIYRGDQFILAFVPILETLC